MPTLSPAVTRAAAAVDTESECRNDARRREQNLTQEGMEMRNLEGEYENAKTVENVKDKNRSTNAGRKNYAENLDSMI